MATPAFSLLWPNATPSAALTAELSPTAAEDLHLAEIVAAIVGGEGPRVRLQQREHFVRQTLHQLCLDPELIAYRQAAFEDLLTDTQLQERLTQLVPQLEE